MSEASYIMPLNNNQSSEIKRPGRKETEFGAYTQDALLRLV